MYSSHGLCATLLFNCRVVMVMVMAVVTVLVVDRVMVIVILMVRFMVMIMIQKCKEMPYSLCLNLKLQVATTAAAFNIYYWTKKRDIG